MKRDVPKAWYSVRFLFVHTPIDPNEPTGFEERITVWHATSVDDAFARAEAEAKQYVQTLDPSLWSHHEVALEQSYWMVTELGDGAEVFAQLRKSPLRPDQYISMFADVGSSEQGAIGQ